MKDEPKYIILGCQGSGTNLVSRLVQQTLGFSVVHDRSLIFNAAVDVLKNPTPDTVRQQFKKFRRRVFPGNVRRRFMLKRHYRQARHFAGLPETIDVAGINTASSFASYLYAFHAYNAQADHQGLKSDDLWESLGYIDAVLPNRRYILLVRDPRDNAISITNKDFGPRNLWAAAKYVDLRMRHYQREVDRQSDDAVITIKYEDLLNSPQEQIEMIAQKWQLPLRDNYPKLISGMEIRSQNQQKWRKLRPADLQACQSVLKDMILRYGYEMDAQESVALTGVRQAYCRVADLVQRVPQRIHKTCRNMLSP